MSAQTNRLQIATRIHHVLLRELGQGIDIEKMLRREHYARDVLLVCDACRGTELADLAQQFRRVTVQLPELTTPAAPGRQARPMEWSRDTSGFGAEPLDVPARVDPGLELDTAPAAERMRPARAPALAAQHAPAQRRWWQRLMPR